MTVEKNSEIELEIESLSSEGSGVGHCEGLAVFVQGGVPGDRLLVHIIKVKKTYAIGKIVRCIRGGAGRTQSDCPVFPRCGGCAFRTMTYETETAEKKQRVEDAFHRLAHMDIACEEILTGAPDRYRNKAQYPVAISEKGEVQLGFFAPRTRRVIPCTDCRLQPAEFRKIAETFRAFLQENRISVYDAKRGKGLIRHLYLRKGFQSGEIMVCIVINGKTLPHSDMLIEQLRAASPQITGIVLNHNTQKTAVILGAECTVLWGEPYIMDTLCGVTVRLSPLSFYQVNHDMAERLYRKAAEFAALTEEETVLDLYCGTGTIGLSMASQAKQIIGAEIVPAAVEDAWENARRNGIRNAEFFCGDAKDAAARLRKEGVTPDVVMLDPPRKGCDEEVLKTVSEMQPQKIVYISCDPATLARDAARLSVHGYQTVRLCAADLFPRTHHVESVALMVRAESKST